MACWHLTPAELVERLRGAVTVGTLANWRAARRGPPYVKIGRKVFYPLEGIEQWEARQLKETN